jgi:hypothetical protein
MTAYCLPAPRQPSPLYLVENEFGGRLGRGFLELDRDTNSRAEVVRRIRTRDIDPVKVLEVIEPCDDYPTGKVTNVTDDLIAEASEPREPRSHAEIHQALTDMRRDLAHDYRKNWVQA